MHRPTKSSASRQYTASCRKESANHLLCLLLPEDLHRQLGIRLHERLLLQGHLNKEITGIARWGGRGRTKRKELASVATPNRM